MNTSEETRDRIAAVRAFNRFYTNVIGVLREGLARTPYTLTEARVMFELAQREATEVTALRRTLDLDAGYLSRILARFESDGLATRERSVTDARRQIIRLTEQGRAAFRTLDGQQAEEIARMLGPLAEEDQHRLLGAMGVIRRVLSPAPPPPAFVLRPPRTGELGWIVYRHGVLYAQQYGWDATFEAMVARIVADYAEGHDPRRENVWIADIDGEPVGSVMCARGDERTARLRVLLVEPSARGMGVGAKLVDECVRFARDAGYEHLTLWTMDVLTEAGRLYERAGFTVAEQQEITAFGHSLVNQVYRRAL